ncbi:MAG TPA: NAD(P)-dependent alcohol dehydrogenase [Candidatus Limnocylindrales bacterium]
MRAIVQSRYGGPDVLRLDEIPPPRVGEKEVLVRVHATAVNPYDFHIMRGRPLLMRLVAKGMRRPKQPVPGCDLAGVVESIGPGVTRFLVGDRVFGIHGGAFADYLNVHQDLLAPMPDNVTFEQAAAVPLAALSALQALQFDGGGGGVRKGQRVLIIGAAGGIGTFAVQLARHFGAEVTGVCSTRNVGTVKSLGAQHVFDYTREDFARAGRSYDRIVDLVGNRSLRDRRRALAPDGTLVAVAGPIRKLIVLLLAARFGRTRMGFFVTKSDKDDLMLLSRMLETGDITPVIERTYPLHDAPAAVRSVGQGHARGKHVITVVA